MRNGSERAVVMKKRKTENYIKPATAVLLALLLLLTGCGSSESAQQESGSDQTEPQSIEFFAMDTYMTLSAYGDDAQSVLEEGKELIMDLDQSLSAENKDSQIAKLNRKRRGPIDKDAGYLITRSKALYKDTGGVFNIAIYPVMKAWGFTTKKYRVPSERKLKRLISRMDLSKLSVIGGGKSAEIGQKGMQIDLGGIAKGYASSKVIELFKANGIESALVNLGGNVQALGTKPDGSSWRVAIGSPYGDDEYVGVLEIADKAAVTSGGYERNFTKNGKTYHHIMDPATGYPADKGLISVTVVSGDGTLADGLSTSLYIMGRKKALDFWRQRSDRFDAVLMDENNKLYVTKGLKDAFTSDKYDITVVE